MSRWKAEEIHLIRNPLSYSSKIQMNGKTTTSTRAENATMAQQTVRTRTPANQEGMKSPGRWNRDTHSRHRDYSPTLGRFIERDPIGFEAGDNNWYRFVANHPLSQTDPMGLYYWVNGAGDYCGPYVWTYTGSWCVKPSVWAAAMDAAGGAVNCWWKCEVETHKTICGKILTATEIISGTLSLPGVRIPKLPGEIVNPFDLNKGLLRDLARRFGMRRAEMLIRSLSRNSRLMAAAKGTFVTTAISEAGISISCGINCS